MDLATVIGLGGCLLFVFLPLVIDGTITYFIDFPSMQIVIGGTIMAVLCMFSVKDLKGLIPALRNAIFLKKHDAVGVVNLMVDLGEKARREGILALERELKGINDEYLRKAIQLAVDGNEVDTIRGVMETEIEYIEARHKRNRDILEKASQLAPAMGMLGTLIGLIQMLKNLDDPSALGPGMAVALITTFYGSLIANVFCIPLLNKLALRTGEEVVVKNLVLNGILSIQAGDNPRVLRDKLETFIAPALRQSKEQ